jgi:CheY-like chemotaxis protein
VTGQSSEAGDRATILVVEDNDAVRELIKRALAPGGSRLLVAGSAAEAAAAAAGTHLDLLLTDVGLPDGRGTDLAARLRAERPGLRVIYITGWHEHIALDDVPDALLLRKPFELAELRG